MLNEFVYCPRLFYYEFVEGVFVESADTLRGAAIHARVDTGKGELLAPRAPSQKSEAGNQKPETSATNTAQAAAIQNPKSEHQNAETIHSCSVSIGSERLGVTAKIDLVEVRADGGDLLALEVCPVDYKAGAPKPGQDANELWDTDKMQLGLQCLILRDNGYRCSEGIIYYRATRQRVRLPVTPELETWVLERIAEARRIAGEPIPPPLVSSPKCVRCSLAPVCLPDETRMLADVPSVAADVSRRTDLTPAEGTASANSPSQMPAPRRLMAARDDERALYLSTPGLRVGRKDETLVVKNEDKVLDDVRINDLTHVALFGNIQLTTQAVQGLCEAEVPVTYFSMGGWFYGITRGHGLKNVFLRIEQFRLARDPATALRLSRQFVHGKIRNHRTLLMRNHLEPPPATIAKLKQLAEKALMADDTETLLGLEGAAAAAYFEQFSGMIKVADELAQPTAPTADQLFFNFNFTHRNRRPPTDPVNAMLSLAYSLLAKDCTVAALAVGFDPYIGFFHQPRFGRPALALDLMEEFRPLIAESVVLSAINNRVVTERDFVRAGEAVNLSAPGRKRFFQTYEQRMSALLTHPVFDYKVSYRRALELQARLLSKTLTGEIAEYVPLTTR
ncbi:MAG: CRISPR-associated endonuclease Cas1 [Verrucomicrobiia bacterium]